MAEPLTTRTPESRCPRCKCLLSAAMDADMTSPRKPQGGEITICIECGKILAFNDDLSLREPTPEEVAVVKADPPMWRFALSRATPWN